MLHYTATELRKLPELHGAHVGGADQRRIAHLLREPGADRAPTRADLQATPAAAHQLSEPRAARAIVDALQQLQPLALDRGALGAAEQPGVVAETLL
jgi:hypothetical protein